ncbi:MAG: hypothetical protein LBK43_02065 [Treponema sp.]|jgi:4'-phosphopantetheinyl transferase|nr:hypothetical protein [Treponema sp.]
MQTIFCLNITLLVPVFDRLVSSLSFSYQKKIYSYYNSKDRLRCLAGKLLVDHIGQGKTILYNEYNKPFFHDGPYFNLTHSGDFACLAVSENSLLGIDIEKQKYGDYLAVAKAVFHPAELNFFLY